MCNIFVLKNQCNILVRFLTCNKLWEIQMEEL